MALLDPEKKKSGLLDPREKLGVTETSSTRASTNRVGKMVEGTPLGSPQSPAAEIDKSTVDTADPNTPQPKPKVKKKEIGVGAYQV